MEHERLLPAVTRRGFLKTIGAGTIVIVADSRNLFDNSVFASLQDVGGTLTTRLIRPVDQLRLRFEFINLEHDVANNQLIAGPTGTPLMKLTLARQHLSERPIPVGGTPPGASSAPIDHRVAGASRLVFAVTPPLALTVPALLDLAAHALVTSVGTGNPTATETMIEVPADLRLSPASDVELTADIAPVASASSIGSSCRRRVRSGSRPWTTVLRSTDFPYGSPTLATEASSCRSPRPRARRSPSGCGSPRTARGPTCPVTGAAFRGSRTSVVAAMSSPRSSTAVW
jgi:hypothetical protein